MKKRQIPENGIYDARTLGVGRMGLLGFQLQGLFRRKKRRKAHEEPQK